jgi:hypothetical protein
MTLRKAVGASPLAVSVAVLDHLATFGLDHEPGEGSATELFTWLAVALACGLVGAFGAGFFGTARDARKSARPSWLETSLLAAAGSASFGFIELSEGHPFLASIAHVALVSIPVAFVVAFVARYVRGIATMAGSRCGAFVRRMLRHVGPRITRIAAPRRSLTVALAVARDSSRGRAPPLLI